MAASVNGPDDEANAHRFLSIPQAQRLIHLHAGGLMIPY